MAQQVPSDIWQERHDALIATIDRLLQSCATDSGIYFDRKETFRSLLTALRDFGDVHFEYFHRGLLGSNGVKLKISAVYPPHYVLRSVLDRIATDVSLIQEAMAQRTLCHGTESGAVLTLADGLAVQALEPAIESKLISPASTAITYFQKTASIRVIPYAPVALVAFPLSSLQVNRDFLAIPHEIGHYVFWNGKRQASPTVAVAKYMKASLQARPKWIKKWMEEIFADVYGCVVGGPVIGLDFQDLELENSNKGFSKDDGEHPVPFLRPRTYIETLKLMRFNNSAAQLEAHWTNRLLTAPGGHPDSFKAHEAGPDDEAIGKNTAFDEIMNVIGVVVDALPTFRNVQFWSDDLPAGKTVDDLYPQLTREKLEGLAANIPAQGSALPPTSWQTWYDANYSDIQADEGVIQPNDDEDHANKPRGWVDVLAADGWTTEGPHGQDR